MNPKNLVAHRGDNTNYPENTYAGIDAALKAGALFIEIDIQMNKDGSLIVIHDANFNHTANIGLSVFDATDKNISAISVHEPSRFKNKHYPTKVPFLNDIITLIKLYPESKVFVEIKNESIDHWGLEKVISELLEIIKDAGAQAIVIGYSDSALAYTQKNSTHQTGLVFNKYTNSIKKIAYKLKPDFMICPYNIIPQYPFEETVWQGDWQWMIYSINDTKMAGKFLSREDIDLIETDDIKLLLKEI